MEFNDPREEPAIKKERLDDEHHLGGSLEKMEVEGGGGGSCCVVCLSCSAEVQSWMFWRPGEPLSLSRSVSAMFLLRKLLRYGREEVEGLLVRGHGVNPGAWCTLCQGCSEHVRKAYQAHEDCLKLQEQIERIGEGLRAQLEASLVHSDSGDVEEEKEAEGAILNLHSMVRKVYSERGAKLKADLPGVDSEDNNNKDNAPNEEAYEPEEDNHNNSGSEHEVEEEEEYIIIPPISTDREQRRQGKTTKVTTTCSKSTKKRQKLKPTKGTYKCPQCVQVCQTLEAFQKHQELHSLHPDFPCPVCRYPLKCQSVRVRHMELKHTGTKFSCTSTSCKFKTFSASTYYKHDNEHRMRAAMEPVVDANNKSADKYTCKFCGTEGFLEELYGHMKYQHLPQLGIESFPCGLCEMVFYKQVEVDRHWKCIHGKSRPWKNRPGQQVGGGEGAYQRRKKFKCDLCPVDYFHKKDLDRHILVKHNKNKKNNADASSEGIPHQPVVNCWICMAQLGDKDELLAHLRSAHPDVYKFKCDQCGLSYKRKSNLRDHMVGAHSARVNCPYCNKPVRSKLHLRHHYRRCPRRSPANNANNSLRRRMGTGPITTTTAPGKGNNLQQLLKCGKCDEFSTYSRYQFEHHSKEHCVKDNFHQGGGDGDADAEWALCKLCNLKIRSSTKFSHLKEVHPASIVDHLFWCHFCSKSCSSQENLKSHIRTMHSVKGAREKHVCEHCGTPFFHTSHLKVHMERHHPEGLADPGAAKHAPRPKVPCRLCGELMLNVRFLRDHLWGVHQDVYRYKCDLCESRFKKPHIMENHKRSKHLKETKTCPYCLKKVCFVTSLKNHWRLWCKQYTPPGSSEVVVVDKGGGEGGGSEEGAKTNSESSTRNSS